jgi:hypothetical protein
MDSAKLKGLLADGQQSDSLIPKSHCLMPKGAERESVRAGSESTEGEWYTESLVCSKILGPLE